MSNARTLDAARSQAATVAAIRLPATPVFGEKACAVLALFR